jgi:TetR/AcrR family transcriptional regulator, transcriptional repressor for nem operon
MRDELVIAARDFIQQRGLVEFSYGALGEQLGIKAPSIHHHFARREQLIAAVATEYRREFRRKVDGIDAVSPIERIVGYAELYTSVARSGRTCLCGAIAAEWAAVGDEPRAEIERFVADQLVWLRAQLRTAHQANQLRASNVEISRLARAIFAMLQGSLALARVNPTFAQTGTAIRALLSTAVN